MQVAGNTLEESVGLITAGNTIVQDADVVGTALKTVSLRLTSTTAELEAMGEETEFACDTLSDYKNLVLGLTDNKVDIVGDDGEYKSTYQILQEISKVWDDLNSMEQSSLMKSLFGVRQANIGASILENFDIAEQATASAYNSEGSAMKEQQKYMESLQYEIDVVKAKWQEFSNVSLDTDFAKGFVNTGGDVLSALTDIVDEMGVAIPIGTAFAGIWQFDKSKQ